MQYTAEQQAQLNAELVLKTPNGFYFFVQLFWHIIEPVAFQKQDYLEGIAYHVQHIFDVQKLIINKPPRHGVSKVVSCFGPAYWLARDPSLRFLIAAYGHSISSDFVNDTRKIVESPLYKSMFPHVQLTTSTRDLLETTRNGSVKAVSPDTGTLAVGANIVIFDDPNNIQQIDSKAHCKSVIDYWENVLSNRINSGRKGARIIVQQRCGFTDLSQHLLDTYKGDWHHLNLPFEADAETYQSKWWNDKRKEGEHLSTLIPDVKDKKKNPWVWATQYNQKPRSRSGQIFTTLNFWKLNSQGDYVCGDVVIPKSELRVFGSTDLAISERSTADYTVFQVWGAWRNYLILLHQFRDRINSVKMLETFSTIYHNHHCMFIGVEDVAFQRMAIQQLRARGLTVKAFKPEGDKVARTLTAQIRNDCGELWFPELPALEDELLSFPNGRHDDIVDSTSQAALLAQKYARYKPKPPPKTQEEVDAELKKWHDDTMNYLMHES